MIISASRRTDLPAWGMEALMEDLRRGERLVPNPYDAKKPRLVSLKPEDVDCVVFWTRNPGPILRHFDELEAMGLPFYVQLTLTGYPRRLEPGVPPAEEVVETARRLVARIGSGLLVWRYDPVILAAGGEAPPLDPAFHAANFAKLAAGLEGTARKVTLSILDEYRNTRSRLARSGYPRVDFPLRPEGEDRLLPTLPLQPLCPTLPPPPWPELLSGLAEEARRRGMEAVACAEPWDLSALGVGRAACIDPGLAALAAARSGRPGEALARTLRDRHQRPGCGCAASVDIGAYGSCRSGCAYCYARR